MNRRNNPDSEIVISAWSSEWMDGLGVTRVADWLATASKDWQTSEILDIDKNLLLNPFDVVRSSGYANPRTDLSAPSAGAIPVVRELNRLRKKRGGPLEERIIEHAASTIPCAIGLHAIDIRRPVPESAFMGKRGSQTDGFFREAISEFRALYSFMPVSWVLCSTFGRGPSVAELCQNRGSPAQVGAVFVSHSVPVTALTEALSPAHPVDVGPGFEVILTQLFDGPMETIPVATYDKLWKVLRSVSIGSLPWEIVNSLRPRVG